MNRALAAQVHELQPENLAALRDALAGNPEAQSIMSRLRDADAATLRAEQAMREAEARNAAELAFAREAIVNERYSAHLYLRAWIARENGPVRLTQDELRESIARSKTSMLSFDVEEDGETLCISTVAVAPEPVAPEPVAPEPESTRG